MATMFPAEPGAFSTSGEEELFYFLKQFLRPDSIFTAWYSPDIKDREPDFILLSPDSGLIVLEVKDWLASQILEADPKYVLLQIGSRQEKRHQPLAQAKEYVHSLMSLLSSRHPVHEDGRSKTPCPVCAGAVFPHMRREEFHAIGLQKVMDESKILFWDELGTKSPFRADASGQKLRLWLSSHFPPLFPFQLTAQMRNFIKSCIFPVVRIDTPRRGPASSHKDAIRVLDHEQENLARSFGPGKSLIQGPAGSGKTLVLAHQAWNLPRVDKNIRRILFICYNLSLPQYISRLLALKQVPMGRNAVEVIPFYALCSRILGEELAHSGEESSYYNLVVNESLERLAADHPLKGHWDAILVDEGQDFTADMVKIVLGLLGENTSLVVAEDMFQSLYSDPLSNWSGVKNMRLTMLERQYRSTSAIAALAGRLVNAPKTEIVGSSGDRPRWLKATDAAEQIEQIADSIAVLVSQGVPMNEIAILYAKRHTGLDRGFPELMREALEARGVLAYWLARDAASKRDFDISTEKVVISTIHSAKGLDFAHVFLAGMDLLTDNDKNRRLCHVGISRARENLAFSIYSEAGLVPALREAINQV